MEGFWDHSGRPSCQFPSPSIGYVDGIDADGCFRVLDGKIMKSMNRNHIYCCSSASFLLPLPFYG